MVRSSDSALPIRLSWPSANDDGEMRIAEANIPQLLFAIRCKLDRFPEHQRGLMAMLAASTLAISAEVGRG